ncbi:unnamed protein product [Tilletia controversa]|uniref:Cytochrome b561 domain-containing protein n=3 Tax=Tilletia TaxID=13289 RepID=A0A8X7MYY1_9BASI|nr:hypothetical protein CF336_g2872 [Tilletia laevis]KAE8200704.1 hypothetical protein CF328_g2891 [Tilletia controversa]KAE8262440.1 hypothetical protein A4X03_0g2451 [Tilletia caries]KAE8205679.1 hypothetical protein CF335_g2218 [Tilletia laevis]KAE8253013.1 hypothetical protein A4X06_0g1765 [Tilletia controversa]
MQLKFGVLVSVVAFAASTHAAKFGDRYCKSGLCISAVYDDQAMNVNYTAIFTGSSVGWIGVGQGKQMPGANMMVGWPMPDGSVVLSQRTTTAHVEPTTQQIKAQAFVPHLDASTTNSSMTVLSWSFPVQAGFASSKTSHIWAMSSTSPNSADASASIVRHNHDGTINLDLTKALSTYAPAPASGTGTGSAPASATASTTSSDSSSSSSGSDSQDAEPVLRDLSDRSVRLYLAHMIVMAIAWMGLVPAGILVGRFGRTLFPNSWFKVHRAVQLSAVLLIIAGFVLAYNAVDSVGDPHFEGTHQRVGLLMFVLVIIQAFWGQIGHAIFHSRGQRWVNFGHIFLGVVLFFGLSLWQVRTGLQEWTWSPPKSVANIIFPVWFGVITAAWLLGLLLLPRPQKKADVSLEMVPTSRSL